MKQMIAVLAALALLSLPALAQAPLSPTQFRDAAQAAMTALSPQTRVEARGELGVLVRRADGSEHQVNLDRAYNDYVHAPETLNDVLAHWARFATQPLEDVQRADRVISVLRPRETIDAYQATLAQAEHPSPLVWRAFAGDLVEVIVFDGDETLRYADEQSLRDLGLSPEQAWAAAPQNLPARLGRLAIGRVEGADELAFVTGGNGLAPSSLLDGRVCEGEGANFLFLVVERNGYIMGNSADANSRRQFADLLNEVRASTEEIMSRTPLGCRNGRVVEIPPPAN